MLAKTAALRTIAFSLLIVTLQGVARASVDSPRAHGADLLFVSDAFKNIVWIYPAAKLHPAPIGSITSGISGPEGLWVDARGVLYVANDGNSTVTEYLPGALAPFRTLQNGHGGGPIAVTTDSNGTVYVTNAGSIMPATGTITEFARGSTTPTLTISDPGFAFMGGAAIDPKGNLLVAYETYPSTGCRVARYAPGSKVGSDLGLQGCTSFTGLAVDAAGNIFIQGSQGSLTGINVYAPGATKPLRTISNGISGPEFFTLTGSGALFVPNYPGFPMTPNVTEYAPGGNSPINTFTGHLTTVFGVAVRSAKH